MSFHALHPLDYYRCLDCNEAVEYPRGSPPPGWAYDLCDDCDARDEAAALAGLRARAAEPLPPIDTQADVRAVPVHLEPIDAACLGEPPRTWLTLNDGDLIDLSDHLEPV